MENVYFELNKSILRDSELPKVEHIIAVLNQFPEAVVSLTGYADKKTGSVKRNQVLSEQRAKVVFDYLVSLGVPAEKLETSANGGVGPIFFNNDVLSRTVIIRPKK